MSKITLIRYTSFLLISFLLLLNLFSRAQKYYDIVVYGGSTAGVTASIQAARMGKDVVFISNYPNVGGLSSSGLGATDLNRREAIGGIAREFYSRVYDYYADSTAWYYTTAKSYFTTENNRYYGNNKIKRVWGGKNDEMEIMWVFEPHVAEEIFREMLLESGVTVVFNERLDLRNGVMKKGTVIQSIKMESGREFSGKVFIDATYEGDLMAKAGVSYYVGREANSKYDEKMNGIQPTGLKGMDINNGNSDVSIDPFIEKGNPSSGLLPFIEPESPGKTGEADKRIQAYTYRFTLSNNPENFRPIQKPDNYNPLWFEHYARVLELNPFIDVLKVMTITPLPNKKTDINHCDFVGVNYAWPEGNYQVRDSLAQMHKDYALGKVWFLQNDPRVPVHIRKIVEEYGLPKDEFVDNDNFPYQLYVREARRMIGEYVMTEHDALLERETPKPIALGTYPLDSHIVSHYVDRKDQVWIEGAYLTKGSKVYPISYQSLTPKAEECRNLLVPVCVSASHTAYSSLRMEPQFMVMGQSAATAASLSIDKNISVQKVPYKELKAVLENDHQILTWND